METSQKSPDPSTKQRHSPSLATIWIAGMGVIGFVFDTIEFGDVRYEDTPSIGYYTLLAIITLAMSYFAWKRSRNRFKDVIVTLFAAVIYANLALGTAGKMNRVSLIDIGIDIAWIATAYALYRGSDRPSATAKPTE